MGDTTIARLVDFARSERIGLGEAYEDAERCPGLNKRSLGGVLEVARIFERIRQAAVDRTPIHEIIEMTWDITGYMDELPGRGVRSEGLDVLAKPYHHQELLDRIKAALRRTP